MKIEIYTRADCQGCIHLKRFMDSNSITYSEYVIGLNTTREEVKAKFPQCNYVPITIIDNELVDYREVYSRLRDFIEKYR